MLVLGPVLEQLQLQLDAALGLGLELEPGLELAPGLVEAFAGAVVGHVPAVEQQQQPAGPVAGCLSYQDGLVVDPV